MSYGDLEFEGADQGVVPCLGDPFERQKLAAGKIEKDGF
jgi:hypothetical protein